MEEFQSVSISRNPGSTNFAFQSLLYPWNWDSQSLLDKTNSTIKVDFSADPTKFWDIGSELTRFYLITLEKDWIFFYKYISFQIFPFMFKCNPIQFISILNLMKKLYLWFAKYNKGILFVLSAAYSRVRALKGRKPQILSFISPSTWEKFQIRAKNYLSNIFDNSKSEELISTLIVHFYATQAK